ncbi:unnamed protein product [Coregonus sp. 'balchen']|nr:unnamed protein product [Coregonus sp. 'balchen']
MSTLTNPVCMWTYILLLWCFLVSRTSSWPALEQQLHHLSSLRYGSGSPASPALNLTLSESAESKVERLGQAFKKNVRMLREKSGHLDLVFLVDESSSVGANNFLSELRFVRKFLSDFPVAPEDTRVALVTFSSKTHVVTRVDHVKAPKSHQHKCSLFNQEIPAITYRGGGTYTRGAFQRAAPGPGKTGEPETRGREKETARARKSARAERTSAREREEARGEREAARARSSGESARDGRDTKGKSATSKRRKHHSESDPRHL